MAAAVGRGIRRIELRHARREPLAHRQEVARIGLDMRIAGGMHVAVGAIQPRRHVEHAHRGGRLEVSGLAGLDARIAGFALHHRQPADLQFGTGGEQQVGAARPRDQRGPRVDVMRILQGRGGGEDLHLVAADLPRQRGPFRHRGEDLERRLRPAGRQRRKNEQKVS
jgi:hypothetical protein